MAEPTGLPSEEASGLISGASFVTKATWSPKQPQFELLNTVTDRGTPERFLRAFLYFSMMIFFKQIFLDRFVFFTVVCHLVLDMFAEPISLNCVCRAKVFRQDENFWLPPDRRPCTEDISLQLIEVRLHCTYQ